MYHWGVNARSIEDLHSDLARLGVEAGDTVMVHASLRRLGRTEGGADGLITALEHAVGTAGTLLMVLGAHDRWAWVNRLDEGEREAHLADAEPFDALTTPAEPEVGVLAEVFRRHQGTRVSNHPEGRFAARGHAAKALLADAPWDDYYGPGSPLARLVARDGKVLRLGADLDTVTLLHHAEYLADVPNKRRVRRHRRVRTADGSSEVRVVSCLDDEHGIVDHPGEDYFATILRAYLAEGRARTGSVGGARSELIDARDLLAFGVAWMNAHLVSNAPVS